MSNVSDVRKKLNRANKRLATMRRKGLGDLSVIPLALREYAKISGETADVFKMPSDKSTAKLKRTERQLDKFLNSKWTSQKGRAEIYRKRLDTFEKKEELKLSKTQALKFFDIVNTDVYSKLKDMGHMDSEQIVELVRNSGRKKTSSYEKALNSLYNYVQENPNFKKEELHSYIESEMNMK